TEAGTYLFTFYARDVTGQVSEPLQIQWAGPDVFEPDDTMGLAAPGEVGTARSHNIDVVGDEDWTTIFVGTGVVYSIEAEQFGTNVDLVLDLYAEGDNGSWVPVETNINRTGVGIFERETMTLDPSAIPDFEPGMFLIRARSLAGAGPGTDYALRIFAAETSERLVVFAIDEIADSGPPPETIAVFDGGVTQAFGTNLSVVFMGVEPGRHEIELKTVPGYRMMADPRHPEQVSNQEASHYDNPHWRQVIDGAWQSATFRFMPYTELQGMVQDRLTGARIAGVSLGFRARSGSVEGEIFRGFPRGALYESYWFSQADGTFPGNVLVPSVDGDLMLWKSGYPGLTLTNRLVGLTPGATTNLGTIYLYPPDTNTNGIDDHWEIAHFGTLISGSGDPDQDEHSNLEEYRIGTDPTDPNSILKLTIPRSGELRLVWPCAPGRTYEVLRQAPIGVGPWISVSLPITALPGDSELFWIIPPPCRVVGY
ncbi:MAG: hypothetical protein AAF492_22535, partial [Verrucomicrobiota bacterium]